MGIRSDTSCVYTNNVHKNRLRLFHLHRKPKAKVRRCTPSLLFQTDCQFSIIVAQAILMWKQAAPSGTGAGEKSQDQMPPLITLQRQFQAGLASLCQGRQRNVLVPCKKLPDLSPLICSANSESLRSGCEWPEGCILVSRFITGDITANCPFIL